MNDFGDAAVARVEQQATALANRLGIQPEIIIQYFNDTAHFPQTLDELNRWGSTPDPIYHFVRRQPNGVWTPLMQGDTPGTGGAKDPGFKHIIANEVGKVQRFQQVDQNGNVFGGSWDPAYNAAHPNQPSDATQQLMGSRSATGFDPNNYVAPVDPSNPSGPYVSVVNGQTNTFATQNEAENDYNARSGSGASAGGGSAPGGAGAGPAPSPPGAAPAGAASPSGSSPGSLFNPSAASAANAAVLAFLEQRRIDEIEKPELALKTQTELAAMRRDDALAVWKQAYEAATLTGNLNGTPTLDAIKQNADLTGYTGQGYATRAQAAYTGLAPGQQTAANASAIWQQIVPGLTPEEAAAMDAAGHQYYAVTHQVMPDDVAAQNLARITGGRITGTGSSPTAAYQHQQNQDAISALTLLSNLRGPENAFAYANTLANLPESVRATIAAAQQNLPTAYGPRNPAQAGLLGDVTGQTGLGQAQTQQGGYAAMASPQVGAGLPAATGPRTTMTPDMVAGPGVGAMPVLRTAQAGGSFADASRGNPQPGMSYAQVITPAGGATQQTQPFMRMDPATQAAIGAQAGAPATGGVQTGRPVEVAQPGVGYGPRTQPQAPRLPFAANQLSPTDINRTDPYAQKVMWAGYENAGGDIASGQWQYQNSLPKAYGPRTGRLRAA